MKIDISDLTALIGKNDAGKSALLDALALFFDEKLKLDEDDANIDGDKKDVRITCEFSELPSQIIIDASNKTKLTDEYLLNEVRNLEIIKIYDGSLKKPKQTGIFAKANHPSSTGIEDLLSLKKADLRKRAHDLKIDISGLDKRVNAPIRRAIWNNASDLGLRLQEIPLDAEDAKKIWDQLKKELPVFSLFKSDRTSTDQDDEAQDPMKTAIDESLKSKEAELQNIAEHVQKEVESIAQKTVEKIREMDPTLASELKPRFQKPSWKNVFKISLTDENQISVNKRGSGVRRIILINFFRAKAEQKATKENVADVIYAIEEPETSQHPNNQKMLMDALAELADDPNRQVILSTHVPMLARTVPSESLRYIEIQENGGRIIHEKDGGIISTVAKTLGVLPDHDVKLFIGVEDRNDINFLRVISEILHSSDNSIPDLYDLENKGQIIFFPMGGDNLALWASRVKGLNVPEFYIEDSDLTEPGTSVHQQDVYETNKKSNCTAYLTKKREMENYLHRNAIKATRSNIDIVFGDYDSVPQIAAKELHDLSESGSAWEDLPEQKQEKKKSQAKKWLNRDAVGNMTPKLLEERDPDGEIISWLTKISDLMR